MEDVGKFKVCKSGGVDVTWSGHTRHYGLWALALLELDGTPSWPFHMAQKSWVSDIDRLIEVQKQVISEHPDRFAELRPDWETRVRIDIRSMKDADSFVGALCVEREPSDSFKALDFDAALARARVANVARGMLEGRTHRDESEAKDALR